MRRVVMTPTFAAGLGVVIAAGLASGAAPSVLRYGGPPDDGRPCAVKGCGPAGTGTLASAKPGRRLAGPVHSPAGKAAPDTHAILAAPRSPGDGQDPVVRYQTVRKDGNGGFQGQITLASRSGAGLPRQWRFRFTYPSGQIVSVWASGAVQRSAHAATVTGGQDPEGRSWGQDAQIGFTVYGPPGPPAGCTFAGQPCHYRVSQTGSYSGSTYGSGGYVPQG